MTDVRAMLACLANEETAGMLGRIILNADPGEGLSRARIDRAFSALERSGLIVHEDGEPTLAKETIKATLRDLARSTVNDDSATRWFDSDGRIRHYPRREKDRRELLTSVGRYVIAQGERITEPELNHRLEQFTADIPTLRRYLVVHGMLAREPDGSTYWRAET